MDDIPRTMSGEQIIKAQAARIEQLEAPPSDAEVEAVAEAQYRNQTDRNFSKLADEVKQVWLNDYRAALTAFVAGRNK